MYLCLVCNDCVVNENEIHKSSKRWKKSGLQQDYDQSIIIVAVGNVITAAVDQQLLLQ